jgi:hypothetical protein
MHAREMIGTHPAVKGQINDALIRCIEECIPAPRPAPRVPTPACRAHGAGVDPVHPPDLDCADICNITGRIMTRRTGFDDEVMRRMLSVCAAACRLCAEECQAHAVHA